MASSSRPPSATVDNAIAAALPWLLEAQDILQRSHPKAASLEIELHNVLGVGVSQMSMSQLEALEEVHHTLLEQLAGARVQLASRQREQQRAEAARLAEEVQRAAIDVCARLVDGDGRAGRSA